MPLLRLCPLPVLFRNFQLDHLLAIFHFALLGIRRGVQESCGGQVTTPRLTVLLQGLEDCLRELNH